MNFVSHFSVFSLLQYQPPFNTLKFSYSVWKYFHFDTHHSWGFQIKFTLSLFLEKVCGKLGKVVENRFWNFLFTMIKQLKTDWFSQFFFVSAVFAIIAVLIILTVFLVFCNFSSFFNFCSPLNSLRFCSFCNSPSSRSFSHF